MDENNVKIKEVFDFFYVNEKELTSSQLVFIQGCKKYYQRNKTLSEKQLATLREIQKYLPGDQVRFSRAEVSQASGMTTEG